MVKLFLSNQTTTDHGNSAATMLIESMGLSIVYIIWKVKSSYIVMCGFSTEAAKFQLVVATCGVISYITQM